MRRSLGSLQRKATPMHEKICSALTVAAEEEDARLEKEFELACEEQQGGSVGAGSSTDHRAGLSTPPMLVLSTRGDGEHASGGRVPSSPEQISARKAARALLQSEPECGGKLGHGVLV